MLFLANIASLAPLVMQAYLALSAFLLPGHADNLGVVAGSLAMTYATKLIKRASMSFLSTHTWLARPCAAIDCSALNTGGPVGGRPGFPSGHVTVTTFIVVSLLNQGLLSPPTAAGIIVAVAWGRCTKHCHTLLQVLAGFVFGAVAARAYSWLGKRTLTHAPAMPAVEARDE